MGEDGQEGNAEPLGESEAIRRSPSTKVYLLAATVATILILASGYSEWLAGPWLVYFVCRMLGRKSEWSSLLTVLVILLAFVVFVAVSVLLERLGYAIRSATRNGP